jgi:hypothetical protein
MLGQKMISKNMKLGNKLGENIENIGSKIIKNKSHSFLIDHFKNEKDEVKKGNLEK